MTWTEVGDEGGNMMNEEEFVFWYECEEDFQCSDAQRKDGCLWGLKTILDEDDEE